MGRDFIQLYFTSTSYFGGMKFLSDRIEKYTGGEKDDIDVWIDRLNVTAAAFKSTDEEITNQMPVMLGGAAYQVWAALPETDKKSKSDIFKRLRTTFGLSRVSSWTQLKELRHESGGNIETTVNKIKTLLRTCSRGQEANEDLVTFFVLDKIFAANGDDVDLSTVI